MKFEQVLQIYWSKGFLYSGRIAPFQTNFHNFCNEAGGLGVVTKTKLLKRFELNVLYNNTFSLFSEQEKDIQKLINILLSQITSVNNQVSEINKYNLIRLYLIKSYRGRSQALGKPSRGQRTWSNAWTAYNYNKTIRNFIHTIQKSISKDKKTEQINYKVIQKKIKKSSKPKTIKKKEQKIQTWF